MNRKLAATLIIILVGILGLLFKVQRVEASGTIYIRADGSIDPPTTSIQRDGDIYTFTANIYDSIVVERDNIVVDGAGYMVQKSYGTGIDLSYRNNVTVKNTLIRNSFKGMYLNYATTVTLVANNIMNNYFGIVLDYSSNNNISGNSVT